MKVQRLVYGTPPGRVSAKRANRVSGGLSIYGRRISGSPTSAAVRVRGR